MTRSRPLPAFPMPSDPPPGDAARDFEVRSITGASYTIVEEVAGDGTRTYRTAYARLPVAANDDGTFTIVDTGTRLVRVVDAPPSWPAKAQPLPPARLEDAQPVAKPSAPAVGQTRDGAPGRRRPSSASSDHWKRLLRRPPRAPVELDPQAFVDELNRRLRADPSFDGDARFVVETDDSGRIVATTWQGPEAMKPVIARIVKSVIGEYECGQPFVCDR